jgi:spore coat protein CotH
MTGYLNSLAFDPSLIRNYLSYDLSRSIGNYAARGEYCEVVINGDYKGLYIFMEKLKIDDNRINIVKMTNTDNSVPDLTGGYVTKADKTTGGDPVAWTMQSYNGSTSYLHDSPKPNEITTQQNNYIRNQFTILQNAATAQNASITNGFPSIIDVPSFI